MMISSESLEDVDLDEAIAIQDAQHQHQTEKCSGCLEESKEE